MSPEKGTISNRYFSIQRIKFQEKYQFSGVLNCCLSLVSQNPTRHTCWGGGVRLEALFKQFIRLRRCEFGRFHSHRILTWRVWRIFSLNPGVPRKKKTPLTFHSIVLVVYNRDPYNGLLWSPLLTVFFDIIPYIEYPKQQGCFVRCSGELGGHPFKKGNI